ncbi:MAG TPA: queuosine salvage family protein [Solirubrobacterales bacterium]|nr:queuosine salvage family protein [Solirubrobacterales bacterium]
MDPVSLPEEVRAACAWVSERARSVRIEVERIHEYAAGLAPAEEDEAPPPFGNDPESAAAFAICMDAINFGSGWWPTVRKRPGHSGYGTMATGLRERFESEGPWSAQELAAMEATTIAAVLGQDADHPLMAEFAAALRDVGGHLASEYGGRFLGPVEAADSIPALAGTLAAWRSFADVSTYEGREVPFYKRAQIAAADLHRAGLADLPGFDRLTAFADNLVPHVLRVDGIFALEPELESRIEAEVLLTHGSPEEVELRACAVHAVELLAAASSLVPAEIDSVLWNRGRGQRYKSLPRPRSRNTGY